MLPKFVIAVLTAAVSTSALAAEPTSLERFRLFTNCMPIDYVIEGLTSDGETIGLSEKVLQNAVESRLRSARIYDSEMDRYLYININVTRRSFGMSVDFRKVVFDTDSEEVGFATTWSIGSTGVGDADYILSALYQKMDSFISNYLRVNEEACK